MDGVELEQIEGALFAVATPQKMAAVSPFGAEAIYTRVAKEINPTQLADEIYEATGVEAQICIANPNPDQRVDSSNPSTIYITPIIDPDEIDKVVKNHVVDPNYGLSPDNKRRNELAEKLSQGEKLDPAELMEALQMALRGG